jgi:hypothetical protein
MQRAAMRRMLTSRYWAPMLPHHGCHWKRSGGGRCGHGHKTFIELKLTYNGSALNSRQA